MFMTSKKELARLSASGPRKFGDVIGFFPPQNGSLKFESSYNRVSQRIRDSRFLARQRIVQGSKMLRNEQNAASSQSEFVVPMESEPKRGGIYHFDERASFALSRDATPIVQHPCTSTSAFFLCCFCHRVPSSFSSLDFLIVTNGIPAVAALHQTKGIHSFNELPQLPSTTTTTIPEWRTNFPIRPTRPIW